MRRLASKYRAVRTNGFASKKEAARAEELKLMEKAGLIEALFFQVPYPLRVNGELICTFVADFVYSNEHGDIIVEDCKGFRTPIYRLKKKLAKACLGIEVLET